MTNKNLFLDLPWIRSKSSRNGMPRQCLQAVLWLILIGAVPCFAQLTPISSPDASYTGSTTLIPITAANGTDINSITDGGTTAAFSSSLRVAQVGVSGWSTWNSPPNAETATPKVAAQYTSLTTFTITLSAPSTTLGFEAESNTFGAFEFTATFMSGATTLGSVTRTINGSSGSLLFAASSSTPITSVVLTTPTGANGFAIAQLRYAASAASIPTLGEWGMAALSILLLLSGIFFLKPRRATVA